MNTDRAYRYSVIPLSALMIATGVAILVAVCFCVPITSPLPFVESDLGNRIILGLIAVWLAVMGIGLLRRKRMAWYALLVYLQVVVAMPIAALFDPRIPFEFAILQCLMNALISTGIYYAIRPVFSNDAAKSP